MKGKHMTQEEKINKVFELESFADFREGEKKAIEEEIKAARNEANGIKAELLKEFLENNINEKEVGDVIASIGVTSTTGYDDEEAVKKYLSDNGFNDFLKVEVSIKKKELNKELKDNAALKEAINPFISTKQTKYLVVTDRENHEKMLEHRLKKKN